MSTPSIVSAFAPGGTLRASINLGNPILANKDAASGEPAGVSVDLARAFARAARRRRSSSSCSTRPPASRSTR